MIASCRLLPILFALAWVDLGANWLGAQRAHLRSAGGDELSKARELQSAYRTELDRALKWGVTSRFFPALFEGAEIMRRRGDEAIETGRISQAESAFRQARWLLPYQTPDVPDGVERILGSLRLRHSGEVTCLSLSPDGARLATGSRDGTATIWDLANGHEICTFCGMAGPTLALALSPDGRQVASGGDDKAIRIWDPVTGKLIRSLAWPGSQVSRLAYHANGQYLVAGGDDHTLRVFRSTTGDKVGTAQPLRQRLTSMARGKDGTLLAVGISDGSIRVWKLDQILDGRPAFWEQNDPTGPTVDVALSPDNRQAARCGSREVKIYDLPVPGQPFGNEPRKLFLNPDPATAFTCAAYSQDGKTFLTGSNNGVIRVWELANCKVISILKGHSAAVNALATDRAGLCLYSASSDHTAMIWPLSVKAQAQEFTGHSAAVWSARFSPNGSRLVTAAADKTVRIWDAFTGKQVLSLKGPEGPLTCAAFSPDGKYVVAGGGDKLVQVWSADNGSLIHNLDGHGSTVTCLSFNGDGSRLATGGADQKIILWDTRGFKKLMTLDASAVVTALAFLSNGTCVASGNTEAEIRLWDAKSGKLVTKWQGHGGSVGGLAVSSDGKFLASGGADQLVRIWDLADPGKITRTLTGHVGPVAAVAFHKDGRLVASSGADHLVKLWQLDNAGGKEIQSLRGHKDYVGSVTFSPDGSSLASASADRTVKIWELTSRDIPRIAEHTGSVEVVAVSPDGKTVASGAADRTIKLWDLATGGVRRTLHGHTGQLTALAFDPDGKRLYSSASDRTLRMWDVASGELLPQRPTHSANHNHMLNPARSLATTPDGKRLFAWVPGNDRFSTLKSYDPESGKEIFTYSDTGRTVLAVCFSKDGRRAAVGARDGSVRVIDLNLQQALPGGDWFIFDKEVGVNALTFDPDHRTLYCGGTNGELKAATIHDRKVTWTMKAHAGQVSSCASSPHGKLLATAGNDNRVNLWELPGGKLLRSWQVHAATPDRSSFVRQLVITPDGRIVTANANTTLYILKGK
jgi:WD40 repeat protein